MVETNSALVKGNAISQLRKLMKSDKRSASNEPHGSSKWSRALVQKHLGSEEALIPSNTAVDIAHGEIHMGDRRYLGHAILLTAASGNDGSAGDQVRDPLEMVPR